MSSLGLRHLVLSHIKWLSDAHTMHWTLIIHALIRPHLELPCGNKNQLYAETGGDFLGEIG
jgi:hypothetical protein